MSEFIESKVLLAALEEDYDEMRRLIDEMTRTECSILLNAVQMVERALYRRGDAPAQPGADTRGRE